jgi:hypothetical protein
MFARSIEVLPVVFFFFYRSFALLFLWLMDWGDMGLLYGFCLMLNLGFAFLFKIMG